MPLLFKVIFSLSMKNAAFSIDTLNSALLKFKSPLITGLSVVPDIFNCPSTSPLDSFK
ncbi:hypothetical protein D3C87_1404360 [compost metagenome]